MIRKIMGGILVGAFAASVIYEIIDREKPEWIQEAKEWFSKKYSFAEAEELPDEP